MDIRSVHPKSLRDRVREGDFSSHNYGGGGRGVGWEPAAEQYGKVQLLTCLSHTQILSSQSITSLPPPQTAPLHHTSGRNLPTS